MSDYYGNATLEDWLEEEVFGRPVPAHVVKYFEEYREGVERDILNWMDSDDGYGNSLSWRGWGRGFNSISDDDSDQFETIVKYCNRYILENVPPMETQQFTVEKAESDDLGEFNNLVEDGDQFKHEDILPMENKQFTIEKGESGKYLIKYPKGRGNDESIAICFSLEEAQLVCASLNLKQRI